MRKTCCKSTINKFVKILISLSMLVAMSFPAYVSAAEVLRVASMAVNGDIREAFSKIAREFEAENPQVSVRFVMRTDAALKQDLEDMLIEGDVDVVTWHSGERLNYFIKRNLVEPITNTWDTYDLDADFSPLLKAAVQTSDDIYAMPISYYQWGIYYKKSLFKRLNLSPPHNWEEFKHVLHALKAQQMTPIFIGTKNPWPVGAWFEYLNLRVNGLEFHNRFVAGDISANDDKIARVLSLWKNLIDEGYFYKEHKNKDLADSFGVIFRERAAMVLSGHFAESFIPAEVRGDIGYFPFPEIDAEVENVFVSPLDIMFVANTSTRKALAKKFLLFIARKDIQQEFNRKFGQFPANRHAEVRVATLLQEAKVAADKADAFTHFFDREVEKQYGIDCLKIWHDFLTHAYIAKTQAAMEHARSEYLVRRELAD